MDFHLNREIRLIKEVEYKNLYSWALQEFDGDESVSSKLISWPWGLHFIASELQHVKHIEITNYKEEKFKNTNSEYIQVTLIPDVREFLNVQSVPRFSMFGTEREIKNFSLTMRCLEKEEDTEHCQAWGIPRYTSEIDFRRHTTDDEIGFDVWLTRKNFDDLRYLIHSKSEDDKLNFYVRGVSGFYSEWSPAISTYYVKVLTAYEEQKVVKSEEYSEPPRLGNVSEFTLYFTRRSALTSKIEFNELDDRAGNFDREVQPKEKNLAEIEFNTALLTQLNKLQTHITKLHIPLWIIAAFLFVLLLR